LAQVSDNNLEDYCVLVNIFDFIVSIFFVAAATAEELTGFSFERFAS
jgi:hypothetical protein